MPIYAYRCESCGHEQDALQKVSDAPLTDCPACGQPALRKQLTAAGFQLKGSGWYVTDFRDKGQGKAAKKADGEAKPAEAGAGGTGQAADKGAASGGADAAGGSSGSAGAAGGSGSGGSGSGGAGPGGSGSGGGASSGGGAAKAA